jgi:class 3 adenylate cyclase
MIREYGGEIVDFYGDQYIAFFPSENPYRSDAIIELILKIEKPKINSI